MANITPVTIGLPAELIARVDALANEQRRSRSNTIAFLLLAALPPSRTPKNSRARVAEPVE